MEIEEKVELRQEAHTCIHEGLSPLPDFNIEEAGVLQLKGWLFHIYTNQSMMNEYHNINERSRQYKNKINQYISEEGYILRERVLEMEDRFMQSWRSDRGI